MTYHDGIADGSKDISSLLLEDMEHLEPGGFTPSGAKLYDVTMALMAPAVSPSTMTGTPM